MLHSWSHPALTRQIISYVTDTPLPRMCTQLSNAITKDHFIHHSDSKAVHSVIQCHHKGPFHTPLGPQGCALSYPMPSHWTISYTTWARFSILRTRFNDSSILGIQWTQNRRRFLDSEIYIYMCVCVDVLYVCVWMYEYMCVCVG